MSIQAEYYTRADGMQGRMYREDETDTTPEHMSYVHGFDSRCPHCWLNHAHSQAAHEAKISERQDATRTGRG